MPGCGNAGLKKKEIIPYPEGKIFINVSKQKNNIWDKSLTENNICDKYLIKK